MICSTCREAADKKTLPAKVRWHAKCKGATHCDCQHKVGPRERFIKDEKG